MKSRRRIPCRAVFLLAAVLLMANPRLTAHAASAGGTPLSPPESRNELEAGNLRFRTGKTLHPRQDTRRRLETARQGQAPIAGIVACSDSRAAVELLFDQGIGDLFVVRVAGNTTGEAVLGSLEYAVEHLHVPLLVVLGHTECGAVNSVWQGEEIHGNLAGLLAPLAPVVRRVRNENPAGGAKDDHELKQLVTIENVRQGLAAILKENPEMRKRVAEGKLLLLGALYDMESGEVAWLVPDTF